MTLSNRSDDHNLNEQGHGDIVATLEQEIVSESKQVKRKRYLSLFISFMLIHTMLMQSTIFTSSLWPFLSQIDEAATEAFFGYVRMIYYLTSALTAPFYGMWSNRISQVKAPLIFGIFLIILGNCLFTFAESFKYNRGWIIFASRCISGMGLGANGLLYTYIVMASTLAERNAAMTMRSIFNGLALFTGPAIQALFAQIGYPAFISWPFYFNMYTAASIFNIGVGLIQILTLIFLFRERWVSTKATNAAEVKEPIKYDRLAACFCIALNGVILFAFGFEGTIGSPFVMLMFGWSRKQVLVYQGIIQAVSGILDPIGTVFVGIFVLKYIKERVTIIIGILFLLLYHVIVLPWPGLPQLEANGISLINESSALNICSSHTWCDSMTTIHVWQYILAYIFLTLSLAAAYAPNVILFSKILGPTKQGIFQGLFSASGFVGLGFGPIVGANIYYHYGPRVAFGIGSIPAVLILLATTLMFNRLVPYHMKPQRIGVISSTS